MLAFSAPSRACACGAAIAPGGANATMNREVALVHWDGATETMVMQLAMDATTDHVALVVPTPTPATVAAADKATFTELDRLTAPQIRHQRHWTLGGNARARSRGRGRAQLRAHRTWSVRCILGRWRPPRWRAVT